MILTQQIRRIQTSKKGGKLYSGTSAYTEKSTVIECSKSHDYCQPIGVLDFSIA